MFLDEEDLETLQLRSLDGNRWRFFSIDCVDTTGYCFRTGFWDSHLVSTHRWTVSTPLADCVDTQADCVDTTGCCFRTGFWDSELVSTHRWTVSTPL
ncbi:hypothetical protein Taro_051415 [Colocasia esculenta]|uniref:Uncharacterized protein n=1 Tax=Colocasia esculenta TaxID=4460 RepID=A0A843XGQ0_COLES|nr:hypothetical protein [Colocasia esculenta]